MLCKPTTKTLKMRYLNAEQKTFLQVGKTASERSNRKMKEIIKKNPIDFIFYVVPIL